MKHLYWLLALLSLLAPAQTKAGTTQMPDTTAVLLPRLLANVKLMHKGWRYHVGDDSAWARPDFNASAWDTINLARPQRELPRAVQTGVYWLRWRFRLSDSLRQQNLLIQLSRQGASDVYLNGRRATAPADRTRLLSGFLTPAPIEIPANGPAEQVLAVRFAPWPPPALLLGTDRLPLLGFHRVRSVAQQRQVEADRATDSSLYVLLAAVFLLLALLHYAYAYYNPSQRANRYFARALLAYGLCWIITAYSIRAGMPSLNWALASCAVTSALVYVGGMWSLRTTSTLFNFQRGRVWVTLLGGGVLLQLLNVLVYFSPWSDLPGLIFVVLIFAEALRLTGRALHQRQRGALIIAAGYGVALLSLLVYVGTYWVVVHWPQWVGILLYAFLTVSSVLSYSLYLAREFALGAELLLVKLGEVERLSAQTLAQEQDKQALLASQNEQLETQVAERTGALQRSFTELQTTQAQLIQKEKMASLGELTAGIAHEIQNPLNFVNNFADVSQELVAELKEAQAAGDTEEATVLADDLAQNLGKIHQHGQRAAGIVRGMLAHSRQSTGERVPTDVNALCDEYLRLAYQGLRAKDKSFNATLKTDLAPDLPSVPAVSQDLGRVLLNLFTNAFYAVQQRQQAGEAGYQPIVGVSTQQQDGHVEICVRDNGTGIPDGARAKIFQPFFTTKPTGQGTGLGLSLSYDIVTKGHGGTLTVESQPGQGTTFAIMLPISAA